MVPFDARSPMTDGSATPSGRTHVVTRVERIAARPARQPVGRIIARQRVVPRAAIEVAHTQRRGVHHFAGRGMRDVGGGATGGALRDDLRARVATVLLIEKRVAVGVGQKVRRLRLTDLAPDHKTAGSQNLIAPVDETALSRGREIDTGNSEFGEGLELARVGARLVGAVAVDILEAQAVGIVIHPDTKRIPSRIGAGELVVTIAVETF